jgi:tetratricopeptide (TPR) repeat protein
MLGARFKVLALSVFAAAAFALATERLARADEMGAANDEARRGGEAQVPPPEYRQKADDALDEFQRGNWEEALTLFREAYAIYPSARALRAIAKCWFEMRRYTKSIEAIDLALAAEVDPLSGSLREDVERLRARALSFTAPVRFVIAPDASAARAAIVLDGAPLDARGAREVRIDIGRHTYRVEAPGYETATGTLVITSAEPQRVAVTLEPTRRDEARRDLRPAFLAAGAGVLAAGALGASVAWLRDRDEAVGRCTRAALSGATCREPDRIALERDFARAGIVLSGAALVASTVVLVLVLPRTREPSPRATAACAASPSGFGCHGVLAW